MTIRLEDIRSALAERYAIERQLGAGGMALVYLARDLKHDRDVAIKVLRPELAEALGPGRFLREITFTAQLDHPHILPLLDSGEGQSGAAGRFLYYVMPLVQGESLRDRLKRERQLPFADAVQLAREIADALGYSHARGIIHRDIKPENILLSGGHARIADFGIARAVDAAGGGLTESGLAIGTPAYMSPEQASGDRQLDARTDLYALGCVLYEMVAGEPPFDGPTPQAILARSLTESPRPLHVIRPGLPGEFETVVRRATARVPADRFQTAADFGAALAGLTAGAAATPPRRPRRPLMMAGMAGAVLVVGAVVTTIMRRTSDAGAGASIAIMPFETPAGDTADAYVGDGIADELLTALSEIPHLRVAARSSAFALRSQNLDVRRVGRQLGVANVLDGTVRRSDSVLHVTVRLANAETGYLLYAQSFDRSAADLFDVQREIALAVVGKLRLRLEQTGEEPGGGRDVMRAGTRDPVAHDLLLRARYGRYSDSRAELERALALTREALARDSTYADAWAELADVYRYLAIYGDLPPDGLRLSRYAAGRAVEVDSLSSRAQASLGEILFRYDWDWNGAGSHLRRALDLNPSDEQAHRDYSRFLRSMQRFEEAREQLRLAEALNPLRKFGANFGRISYFQHDYARAIREMQVDSNLTGRAAASWLGQAYLGLGQSAKAESLLARGDDRGGLAVVYARTGRPDQARRLLADPSLSVASDPYSRAQVFAALGEADQAVLMLEEVERVRGPLLVDLQVDPLLDPLRDNPGFQRLVARMGFPASPSR